MTAPNHNARRESVRVGAGAGYAGDRWEPALELVEQGNIDYLVFECLAERTIAREALTKLHNPELGYNPGLVERMRAVLPECLRRGVRIVTNMGAANPLAAARRIRQEAADLGINELPCAVVLGDDVADTVRKHPELTLLESGDPLETILGRMAAANAYLGADAVAAALATGAPVIVTGRAGRQRRGDRSPAAPSPAISSNVPGKSPAAISPIPGRRTCRTRTVSASPSPM